MHPDDRAGSSRRRIRQEEATPEKGRGFCSGPLFYALVWLRSTGSPLLGGRRKLSSCNVPAARERGNEGLLRSRAWLCELRVKCRHETSSWGVAFTFSRFAYGSLAFPVDLPRGRGDSLQVKYIRESLCTKIPLKSIYSAKPYRGTNVSETSENKWFCRTIFPALTGTIVLYTGV